MARKGYRHQTHFQHLLFQQTGLWDKPSHKLVPNIQSLALVDSPLERRSDLGTKHSSKIYDLEY